MCKVCVRGRARRRGSGPGGAAAGAAAAFLSGSGLRGPRRSCPPRGFLARAGYLPAIFRGGRALGRGRRRPGSLLPPAGARSGCWPRTLPPGHRVGASARALSGSACPEARRLGGRLGPRPRGRPRRRRARCPPRRRLDMERGSRSAGAGASAVVGLPRPRRRALLPPGPFARPPPPPPAVARIPSLRLLW